MDVSKCGASLYVGHHAAWYTVGPRGQRATLGLPGTGIFWTERITPIAPSMPAIAGRSFSLWWLSSYWHSG